MADSRLLILAACLHIRVLLRECAKKMTTLAGGRALRAIESCINLQRRLSLALDDDLLAHPVTIGATSNAKRRERRAWSPKDARRRDALRRCRKVAFSCIRQRGGSEPGKSKADAFCVISQDVEAGSENNPEDTISSFISNEQQCS